MTKIPSISFEEVEQSLHIVNIVDVYKVGDWLKVIIVGGITHELPLASSLDALGIDLTGLELVTCSAVGDWLTFDTQPITNVYELARRAVEQRQACYPDETIIIWEGEQVKVRLYRSQDQILMDLTNGEPREAERVTIGQLTPSGWRFTLTAREYSKWVKKARRLI